MPKAKTTLCPCGSNQDYDACCGRYHSLEADAPTAEALMRSRYTAYVMGLIDYLLKSWHPATRPAQIDLESQTKWLGLKVVRCEKGKQEDSDGQVSFVARYRSGGKGYRMTENSYFEKYEGRWYYHSALKDEAQV